MLGSRATAAGPFPQMPAPSRSQQPASAAGRPLRRHRIPVVPHSVRSSFRDWAAEETDHPREEIEAALAHVVRNQTEAAYARSDLFESRHRRMDDWAAYLDGYRARTTRNTAD